MTHQERDAAIGRLHRELVEARRAHEAARQVLMEKGKALQQLGLLLQTDPGSVVIPGGGIYLPNPATDALADVIDVLSLPPLERLLQEERTQRQIVAELEQRAKRAGLSV